MGVVGRTIHWCNAGERGKLDLLATEVNETADSEVKLDDKGETGLSGTINGLIQSHSNTPELARTSRSSHSMSRHTVTFIYRKPLPRNNRLGRHTRLTMPFPLYTFLRQQPTISSSGLEWGSLSSWPCSSAWVSRHLAALWVRAESSHSYGGSWAAPCA